MLDILKNPKTENYKKLKEEILDHELPWFYNPISTTGLKDVDGHSNHPFYSHIILNRPEVGLKIPQERSSLSELAIKSVTEILRFNNKDLDFFFTRMSINSTFPIEGNQFTVPHKDHDFPHTNFICYINDDHGGGGRTFVQNHLPHSPVEDECIVFTGKHYMELPKKARRIIIVATLISY
tara:strand:- start:2019 stop:2558 length:540 start_codon:yes stop_codon:yes gene_type:complete